jgi:hypothetical protein
MPRDEGPGMPIRGIQGFPWAKKKPVAIKGITTVTGEQFFTGEELA